MRKSEENQQSHTQTIQITVTSRNVTGKAVVAFVVNPWDTFAIYYDQNQENACLENYICVRVLKHRPVPIHQVFCTRCMLCLLQSWRFQLTALLRQTMKREQNIWSITFPMCSFKHAHICI